MTNLTYTRLADGDLLCREYPIRLVKPRGRRGTGWMIMVPTEHHPALGWMWSAVRTEDSASDLWGNNERDARALVAVNLGHIRNKISADIVWTKERRQQMAEGAERTVAERNAWLATQQPQPRRIPVLYEFNWERVEGLAEFDPDTGVLTMKIHPDGPVHKLLAGTSETGEIRTLSFGWTREPVAPAVAPPAPSAAVCSNCEGTTFACTGCGVALEG